MFFFYLEAHVNNRANPASLLESNFPKTTTTTKIKNTYCTKDYNKLVHHLVVQINLLVKYYVDWHVALQMKSTL